MSQTYQRIVELVRNRDIRVSEHGYDELADDGILIQDVLSGLKAGEIVEDYPEFHKGPCVLVLERDPKGSPIHVLWGIPRGAKGPAVVITAYRPDSAKWTNDFTERIK